MRKCRLKSCRARLPKLKDCEHSVQRKGFCGFDCATEYGLEKSRQAAERKRRQGKRARRDNDLAHQIKLTQLSFNKLMRLLDAGKPCISCGEYRPLEAGHFKSTGAHPELRFHPLNCHGQCRPCNGSGTRKFNRGANPEVVSQRYESGLKARYGTDLVEWLKGHHDPKHHTCDDLRDMRKQYNADIRRLEEGFSPSKYWRKIPGKQRDAA